MNPLRRVVIVGNGIAGATAADTLRDQGFDGDLTVVGDETHAAYSRPALSKALLRDGDLTAHQLPAAAHGAIELLGVGARGLDVDRRTVLLDDGTSLPYDGLVIASGCRARRLGDHGDEDTPDELTLRTIDDAWRLRSAVTGRPDVVVVGGGPLGMEIASSCLDTGCEVTLVSQGAPLVAQLGGHISGLLVSAALARGLRIIETSGAHLVRGPDGPRVVLAEGQSLEAGLVVTAIGDLPNIEWLGDSGLLTNGFLVSDGWGRLRPDIVAAGDVAAIPTPLGLRRVPLWSSAIEQGRTAATALLHSDAPPTQQRPYFWTEQFGTSLKAVGHFPVTGEPELVDGDPAEGRLLLRWDGDAALGAVAAVNYRIPIPRLRRLCEPAPAC